MKISKLTINKRIAIGFAVAVSLTLLLGIVCYVNFSAVERNTHNLVDNQMAAKESIMGMRVEYNEFGAVNKEILLMSAAL